MKYLVQLCRIIVGVIFIISGFVKAVDPIGFGYKLEEYFDTNVFNIRFLHDLALEQATLFSVFEIMLGVLLLLGLFRKFTAWALLVLIVFFSFLTFYSAYFNKVTDCGCFGDALHLEPWQSFYKDLFLLILIVVIVLGQKYIKPLFKKPMTGYAISIIALLISCWVSYIGISKLPLIDFRAYAIGENIHEGMQGIPDEVKYLYILKDKKTGEEREFEDFPPNYEDDFDYVDSKSIILKKGVEPAVHDFILECDGEDRTDEYLSLPQVVMYITPFPDKVSESELTELNALFESLSESGIETVGLSAAHIDGAAFPACLVDQTTLKTIIRSNPGIILLEEGTVKAKFDNNPLPSVEEIRAAFN